MLAHNKTWIDLQKCFTENFDSRKIQPACRITRYHRFTSQSYYKSLHLRHYRIKKLRDYVCKIRKDFFCTNMNATGQCRLCVLSIISYLWNIDLTHDAFYEGSQEITNWNRINGFFSLLSFAPSDDHRVRFNSCFQNNGVRI